MSDLTAAELELEALLESRLEIITARLQTLSQNSQHLHSETSTLWNTVQGKFKRLYIIEDNLLRLQGKPGLSNLYIENGSQPRRNLGIGNSEIEEIKMGVKTLRRKFQAAGAVVTTVGWWRHLKEKANEVNTTVIAIAPSDESPTQSQDVAAIPNPNKNPIAKLSIDTVLANHPSSPVSATSPTSIKKAGARSPALLSPKSVLSPTSASTKKRNTLALQQIFTSPTVTTEKPLHEHYVTTPINQRAHPSLGLFSPPMSPHGDGQSASAGNTLMHGLSMRS
ncbi:hypothetical protein BG011_006032 [Mortierella polycephala]|uniref:Uncharacterized protein n=1 Tax=Mortierella polycephala TaxID=41804 RepID=A0A9P6PTV0_9FUNG|nr:hypothetical protein BG011_006032 [Mortierella polycephala]